jgi:hypothetical protein
MTSITQANGSAYFQPAGFATDVWLGRKYSLRHDTFGAAPAGRAGLSFTLVPVI